ncbi:RDD family protein [Mycoplasma procyoni]|uniref:RDD family protein n=1 Tax=Mycoplasma procyoni TaxID=568784 RepID=UPI00197C8EF9|nr:RDD family protein [Mycoplasma procyoni]MBN3534556.1 RDD family protein [Mycoplasma procyoni]
MNNSTQKNIIKASKLATFWIRLLAGFVDILIFLFFSFVISFLLFHWSTSKETFYISYFLWFILEIFLLAGLQIIAPLFDSKTQTLGRKICKLGVTFSEPINKTKDKIVFLVKKEIPFSVIWIILLTLFPIVINPDLAHKWLSNPNVGKISVAKLKGFSNLEIFLITFPVWFSYLIFIAMFLSMLSILISKRKMSFMDIYSKTRTIYLNKTIDIKQKVIFEPEDANWEEVIWK